MKLYKLFLFVGLFTITGEVYSKQYEYTGECGTDSKTGNFEQCLDKELLIYDKELNDLYKTFSEDSLSRGLKKSETSWIRFKEDDCSYMAQEVNDGLFYQFIYKACLINKTKARIDDLKRSVFYSRWFKQQA